MMTANFNSTGTVSIDRQSNTIIVTTNKMAIAG
jgi:hypothetical protein